MNFLDFYFKTDNAPLDRLLLNVDEISYIDQSNEEVKIVLKNGKNIQIKSGYNIDRIIEMLSELLGNELDYTE